jgi:hypothetical protein
MSGEAPRAPAGDIRKDGARLVRGLGPAAAVVLAVLAILAAYTATRVPQSRLGGTGPAPSVAFATFDTGWPLEPGPLGQPWRWMNATAGVSTPAHGRYYLAFRASSVRGRFKLSVVGGGSVRVGPFPTPYIVWAGGVSTGKRLQLRVSSRPQRVSARDRRLVTIRLSAATLFREPVAALPGAGFYSPEGAADGTSFSWLGTTGSLDVVAAEPSQSTAWITLDVSSPQQRRLTGSIVNAQALRPILLPAGRPVRAVVGPIPLPGGRGRVRFAVTPPGHRLADDSRRLGAKITLVATSLSPPRHR